MPPTHPQAPIVPTPASPEIRRRCPFAPPQDYEELRDSHRLGHFRLPDGSLGWLVTSYADATHVLADPRFSSSVNQIPLSEEEDEAPGWLFGKDAPEHTRLRRALTPRVSTSVVRALEPRIKAVVRSRLDRIDTLGAPADLFRDFAWPVPRLVVHELLDIGPAHQNDIEKLLAASDDPELPGDERLAALRQAWSTFRTLARERRDGPGAPHVPHPSEPRDDESAPTDEEAASLLLSLRLGGHAPVSHTFAMSLFLLLQRSDGLRGLPSDDKQLDDLVDELLRYIPSNNLGVMRVARQDVTLSGYTIRAGDFVYVNLPVANRDPARLEGAEELDPARDRFPHLSFGHGIHRCPGSQLARLEIRVMLSEVAARWPGLRLAVQPSQVRREITSTTYGLAELPVAW
jgi:cytochrome P450